MKYQIATTPEQSQRLIACGVNPDSADMFYTNYTTKPNDKAPCTKTAPLGIRKDLIPAWSLSALLALLPKHLKDEYGYNKHSFVIEYAHTASPSQWRIAYDGWYNEDVSFYDVSPIEACVEAIEWLTANGYTLNTK